jgi:hypothetical protein
MQGWQHPRINVDVRNVMRLTPGASCLTSSSVVPMGWVRGSAMSRWADQGDGNTRAPMADCRHYAREITIRSVLRQLPEKSSARLDDTRRPLSIDGADMSADGSRSDIRNRFTKPGWHGSWEVIHAPDTQDDVIGSVDVRTECHGVFRQPPPCISSSPPLASEEIHTYRLIGRAEFTGTHLRVETRVIWCMCEIRSMKGQ